MSISEWSIYNTNKFLDCTICLISFSNSQLITVLDKLIDMFSNESHDDLERIMMVENHHPHSIDPRR